MVLFDLDGTLYDNRPRTLRIVHAFAAQLGAEEEADARILRALRSTDLSYLLEDALRPRGVSESVLQLAKDAWAKRFFTDAACADDVPVAGAVAYVRACWERGATVVYLTGRDTPGMMLGTTRTLRDDGFPLGVPRVELVMKPTFEENDTAFKRRLLAEFDRLGAVVGGFDNEPVNCNMLLEKWPDCASILLDTQRAPGAPPLDARCAMVPDFLLR